MTHPGTSLALVVLDTHAWLWLASAPEKLSAAARAAVDAAERLAISPMTPWELALKHSTGKLELDYDVRAWLRSAILRTRVEILPLTVDVAIRAVELRRFVGRDPADTAIVATAQLHGAPLITRDARIVESRSVATIW